MTWKRKQLFSWDNNEIKIGYVLSSFEAFQSYTAQNLKDTVRLHFGLKGDYSFSYKQLNLSFELAGGHHNIMYSKGLDLEITNKTLEIETFGIEFPASIFLHFIEDSDDFLNQFSTAIVKGESKLLSAKWGSINLKIQGVIDEIISNPYDGTIKNVFLMAKSLELLVLCIDNYRQLANKPSFFLKHTADKEKIIAARDFINANINNPPNMTTIARTVGINEYKLKNGFKELFQTTIFNYQKSQRLDKAKTLLLETQKTAAEIAFQLGYSSPQHFNTQFQKHFGKTPKSIRINP